MAALRAAGGCCWSRFSIVARKAPVSRSSRRHSFSRRLRAWTLTHKLRARGWACSLCRRDGGEVFIEGYRDSTAASPLFSSDQEKYPTLLDDKYRTGFVVTCPSTSTPL